MIDYYHIYFTGEIIFKNLSKDDFEFFWDKLYTSYINDLNEEYTFEIISKRILKSNLIISIPHSKFNTLFESKSRIRKLFCR